MKARWSLGLLAGILLALGACSAGEDVSSSGAVPEQSASADFDLLTTISDSVVKDSGVMLKERLVEARGVNCGDSMFNQSGKQAQMTWVLTDPKSATETEVLRSMLPSLRAANEQYFGGKAEIADRSDPPGGVSLRVDGIEVSITIAGESNYSLHASGPCRDD